MTALRWLGLVALGFLVGYNAWRLPRERVAAARLRAAAAAPPATLRNTPRVSILVAAWNEAAGIERHMRSVLALTYPDYEYVLCAGGPDGTYDVARRLGASRVTVLEQQPGEGKQRALLRCLKEATGEVTFLTDADCEVDEGNLRRLIAPIVDGQEAATTGGARPRYLILPERWLAATYYFRERHLASLAGRYSPGLQGCNCAVRRDVLNETRALEAPAATGTDYRLARVLLAAGHRIVLVPESTVATDYPWQVQAYTRQQGRWLRNLYVHGSSTGDGPLVRHAALASLSGTILLGGAVGPAVWVAGRAENEFLAVVGRWLTLGWMLLIAHGLLARARQAFTGAHAAGVDMHPVVFTRLACWLALDAWVWATTPLSLLRLRSRERW